ncbi:MAG: ATP-binding protein [Leptospira sp.]|nr:ATP-binding protein [Leptospira sp.]NCS93978.1 ATP-binding protein [Leptospira sp.]
MKDTREFSFEIPNNFDSLQGSRDKIRNFLEDSNFSSLEKNRILLSLDEAITNIIEHGYTDQKAGTITVQLEMNKEGTHFKSSLIDDAVKFNPLMKAKVNPNDFIEESRDGGMGIYNYIHLMKVEYEERPQGGNILKLNYTKKV